MTVRTRQTDGISHLHCSNCPSWEVVQSNGSMEYGWEMFCPHILDVILSQEDDDIEPEGKIQLFATSVGPYMTQDASFSSVVVTLGPLLRGGAVMARGGYAPEYHQSIDFEIGLLAPGEGRLPLIRAINDQIQAKIDLNGTQCPSKETHNYSAQQEIDNYLTQEMRTANNFCLVMERCCIPCFRNTASLENITTGNVDPPEWAKTKAPKTSRSISYGQHMIIRTKNFQSDDVVIDEVIGIHTKEQMGRYRA